MWKGKEKGAWSLPEKQDGIFMQCEAPSAKGQARAPRREPPAPPHAHARYTHGTQAARCLFFTALKDGKAGRNIGETISLDIEQFALFPRLFR